MRRFRSVLRFARLTLAVALWISIVAAPAAAQSRPAKAAASRPPIARFLPRDGLLIYFEFSGLESHDAAWRQTAAYRMLNETTLGAMLEDVLSQVAEPMLRRLPESRVEGTEVVMLAKHMMRSGFAYAVILSSSDPKRTGRLLVVRGGARKDVRTPFSRLMLTIGGPKSAPQLSKRASGRSVVLMSGTPPRNNWAWWAEQDDLVIALDRPEGADLVAEVLDGKHPSAVDHPFRAPLTKTEGDFEPVGWGFVDTAAATPQMGASVFFRGMQVRGVERLDFRWGFSGEALMSVFRIQAPRPRQGTLALFDQPTFDTASLPEMPAGLTGFRALSLDLAKTFDVVSDVAHKMGPRFGEAFDRAIEGLQGRTRIQLRKDVLAHLGPKIAFYEAPKAAVAPGKGKSDKPAAPEAAPGPFDPAAVMMGFAPIPRFTLAIQIDDPVAFGRSLDSLMILANQELRARAKAAAAASSSPTEKDAAGDVPPSSRRRAADATPAPEFKMMPGQAKSYVLVVPSEQLRLPAGLRPTIRVGAKHVAIAATADAARTGVEVKPQERWAASADQKKAVAALPSDLIYLNLNDPRPTLPRSLANVPVALQAAINAAIASAQAGPTGAMKPVGARGGAPAAPGAPPGTAPATSPGFFPGLPPGTSPGPGAGAMPGATSSAKSAEMVQIKVDPAKLPSVDALKALLFPGTVAVAVDDQGVRFVTREAFPDIVAPISAMAMAAGLPAFQKARGAVGPQAGGPAPASAFPGARSGVEKSQR